MLSAFSHSVGIWLSGTEDGPQTIKFIEIKIKIQQFTVKKMFLKCHLQMVGILFWPQCIEWVYVPMSDCIPKAHFTNDFSIDEKLILVYFNCRVL